MLARYSVHNNLLDKVNELGLDQKSKTFMRMNENSCTDFPILSLEDLECITLGNYQLKMAQSYVAEHIANTGRYEFQVCTDERIQVISLLRANIQSRHKKGTSYKAYIQYEPNESGYDAITGYCCRYKVGSRTVGTCSHVASILWILGYQRHRVSMPSCGQRLPEIFDPSDIESDTEEQ